MIIADEASRSVMLVHATGNANVRQAAQALHQAGMLWRFVTSIAWHPGERLERLLPRGLRHELARRSFPGIPPELISTSPRREIGRLLALRMGWRSLTQDETSRFSIDRVTSDVTREAIRCMAKRPGPGAIYGFDDAELYLEAERRGIRRIFEMGNPYFRTYLSICETERELRPEWSQTLTGLRDSRTKLENRDRLLRSAELIVVASSFSAKSLESYPGQLPARVVVVPYGAPPVGPPRETTRREDPLRILYVGKIGQQKGVGYLIDAVERLDRNKTPYSLTLLGSPVFPTAELKKFLNVHRWIPSANHSEVLRIMREHDVLVFPTLFDGFGLVILEAMAQGTVVIATPNCAAPDVLEDGRDGFIVPIRLAEDIAQRLAQLAEDRDLLARMGESARLKALSRSWDRYHAQWLETVNLVFS